VDEDNVNRLLTATLLKKCGFHATLYSSAAEAVEHVRRPDDRPFDLAVIGESLARACVRLSNVISHLS
jgi:CheY-like chemotaxis protein